jgi:hypothetical protein
MSASIYRLERIRMLPKRSALAVAIPAAEARAGGKFSAFAGSRARREQRQEAMADDKSAYQLDSA